MFPFFFHNFKQALFNYHPKLTAKETGNINKKIEVAIKKSGYKLDWETSRYIKSLENLARCFCSDDFTVLKIKAVVYPHYSDRFSKWGDIHEIYYCPKCQMLHAKKINNDIED